ncbi:MAG TPA: hypothetical protein VMR76_01585 [Candidatus Saccharimonadia bacterium]|nr:hypothetical protein [Candidatus Saccharimonadia bacterium]
MDDDNIQDLKQFIAATVTQQTSDLQSDISGLHNNIATIHSDLKNLDVKLSLKIDNLSKSVADALDTTNEVTDSKLKDHEKRIVRLEHKAA